MSDSTGRLLRWIAALLVRGPDAPFVLGDLEEGMRRDVTRGMSASRARRRYAFNALGSAFSLWRARLPRGLPRMRGIGTSLLDVRLAFRMLLKHRGLTAVAVFALALGIPASLAPLHVLRTFDVTLPFDEGERIVGLRHRYVAELEAAPGSLHELAAWRETLTSFEHIGAARPVRHNVVAEDGRARPWRGSQMSASSFAIVRVPPLLGRPLLESDEVVGAPDVVVLGYDMWRTFLHGDPDVLGRTVRIGGTPHTVVGVMPEGFLFPERDHLWLPLRAASAGSEPGEGPELWIYGRLAKGATEARALAQMTAVHRGLAEAHPQVYEELRPEIVPFTYLTTGNPVEMMWMIFGAMQLFALVLLAVACGNVGTLILARTAARSGEIAVRTALGASRARIVSQLFVESLVLAVISTGIGLVLVSFVAERVQGMFDHFGNLPFWVDLSVDYRTVLPAMVLAVFCAVIAGVVPALKVTGSGVHLAMQRMGAGRAGVRFGHGTTVLIVTEVALGVVCLFVGGVGYRVMRANGPAEMAIRPEQFLTAELRVTDTLRLREDGTPDLSALLARTTPLQQELTRRLAQVPEVRGVAFASRLPGQAHASSLVEVEGQPASEDARDHRVLRSSVDVGFFEGLEQPIIHGRDFTESDLPARAEEASRAIVVNTTFVQRVLQGRNAIGQRVRYVARAGADPGPWLEIVGVVGPLGMVVDVDGMLDGAGIYHPVPPGALQPLRVAIRMSGDPMAFAPRLYAMTAAIDPAAIVLNPMPMSAIQSQDRRAMGWGIFAVAVVAAISVVLSIAGLYALMAFTVAQRRHEIGVRTALGADASRIITFIARRALMQLAIGIALGVGATAVLVMQIAPDATLTPIQGWPLMLAATAGAIILVGLLACISPTLRGLRIRPIEALKM